MKKFFQIIMILFIFFTVLVGCGLKGPLYLS